VYVRIHTYLTYFTDACSPTHSLPTTAIGPARPRTFPLPSLPPSLPPHTQPHIPKAPCIPTGEYDTLQCAIQLTTQQPCPGTAGPHNGPRSEPSVYVRMHIYRICFTDAFSPTHNLRAPVIGFAGPAHPASMRSPFVTTNLVYCVLIAHHQHSTQLDNQPAAPLRT